jgi:hypothetical protein
MTMGIVSVAFLAVTAAGVGPATMTLTWSRTSSAAKSASRSKLFSAKRYSIAMF